ncbi:MAG: SDR family NAD(P)-dependent oxidoreductase [Roseivivax sp.]|nr:SDR family NAD(P)-dependent oxidoreductase [Roseivivax sp.]
MTDLAGRTVWIIGASEGLGRALAQALDVRGARLVLSARNQDRLAELSATLRDASPVAIDVRDADSVREAVRAVGRFDRLVYCAGVYEPMKATAWQAEAAVAMGDVNFLGALRVLGETIPAMVAEGRGDITLIGSLSGYRGLPAAIGYGASKAALVSLAETMRHDLKGSGVTIRLVNPGFIRTRLTDKNSFAMPMLMEPEAAAEKVVRAMMRRRFRTDFPAPFSWAIRAYALLPDWIALRG